jgi:hypothetical protein
MKIHPVGSELFHAVRWTDGHDEAIRNYMALFNNIFGEINSLRHSRIINRTSRHLITDDVKHSATRG